jgi:acyl-CoA synthetase (AMP-forming)/AMP-acid ligase II
MPRSSHRRDAGDDRPQEDTMTTTAQFTPTVFRSHWPDVEIPRLSLPELLLAGAAERADAPAIVEGPTGRITSYVQLAADVRRVAAGLAAHGLRKGDVLALLAPNMPEWLVAAYGAMTAGGTVAGINPLYTPDEVAAQLADADARFLVTVPPFLDTARAAVKRAGLRTVIVLHGPPTPDTLAFRDLTEHGDEPPAVAIDPDVDLALLPYSSGTSGLSKGVMLTHRACVANVLQQRSAVPFAPQDRTIAVAPFFHATGFGVVANGALHAGATVVTMPRFDLEAFLGLIEEHRITKMIVVPPIVLALAKHPAVDRYDLSSLQWVGCGAAPLGAELQEACARRLGRPVLQGYGMTEVTAGVAIWDVGTPVTAGAAGKLLPNVQARIVDLVTGSDRGPGEVGELWLRGPSTMAGYLRNPEATAATLDADGWLHTGDLARIDRDGALFIVDRLKELIKVKAFAVAPAELEAVLRTHPAIAEAAVVPVPDAQAGEVPKAFVVHAGDGPLSAEEVMAYVAERVAPHKRVRHVEFIDAIPTSPAGKTLRRLLKRP